MRLLFQFCFNVNYYKHRWSLTSLRTRPLVFVNHCKIYHRSLWNCFERFYLVLLSRINTYFSTFVWHYILFSKAISMVTHSINSSIMNDFPQLYHWTFYPQTGQLHSPFARSVKLHIRAEIFALSRTSTMFSKLAFRLLLFRWTIIIIQPPKLIQFCLWIITTTWHFAVKVIFWINVLFVIFMLCVNRCS